MVKFSIHEPTGNVDYEVDTGTELTTIEASVIASINVREKLEEIEGLVMDLLYLFREQSISVELKTDN